MEQEFIGCFGNNIPAQQFKGWCSYYKLAPENAKDEAKNLIFRGYSLGGI